MTKIIVTTCLSASLLSASNLFIGASVGSLETKLSTPQNSNLKNKIEKAAYGLKIGVNKSNYRIYAQYLNQSNDENYNTYLVSMNADYVFRDTYENFSPFIGVNLGYLNNKHNSEDLSASTYGLNAGFIFNIYENIDLEYAYQYMTSDSKKKFNFGEVKYKNVQTNTFSLIYNF